MLADSEFVNPSKTVFVAAKRFVGRDHADEVFAELTAGLDIVRYTVLFQKNSSFCAFNKILIYIISLFYENASAWARIMYFFTILRVSRIC